MLQSLNRIVTTQHEYGFPSHLIINTHSWEFYEPTMCAFSYTSEKNYEFLEALIKKLAETYNLEHVTMSKLGRILLENKRLMADR